MSFKTFKKSELKKLNVQFTVTGKNVANGILIRVKIKESDKRNLFKIPFNVYFIF